ncbi:hypothetical protein RF11_03355 [Thelohanellus kitauei]|uniref:Uncharacterized protein n=1 Tax=Thelohanellus kitauei TaxID=669202 RepID=A0A0C2N1N9_THEKT|nr:hypothetical protein RF11_03355 [Thelohanellus kitauei]
MFKKDRGTPFSHILCKNALSIPQIKTSKQKNLFQDHVTCFRYKLAFMQPKLAFVNINSGQLLFAAFLDHKIIIRYNIRRPYHQYLYPSILLRLEIYDISQPFSPLIMNLSVGGWRMTCPSVFQKTDTAFIMYDNNGKVVVISLRMCLFDSQSSIR